MNFNTPGMNTHYDQDKDRQSWSASIEIRNYMIQKLKKVGKCPKRAHEMKLKDLEHLCLSIGL